MIRRSALRLAGEESFSYDRLRLILTSPREDGTPWVQLPRTFDLDAPEQYFSKDIRARHENLLTRTAWAAAFRTLAPNGQDGQPGPSVEWRCTLTRSVYHNRMCLSTPPHLY